MLGAGMMIYAIHPALHHSPNAFNAVRGSHSAPVLAAKMIDRLMLEKDAIQTGISRVLIRHERRADLHIVKNRILQCLSVRVLNCHCRSTSAAFTEAHHGSLAYRPASGTELFRLMFVSFFGAEKGFINLDRSPEFFKFPGARLPESLEYKPCRLLSNPDLFSKLHGTDTLPRRDQQVHSVNPFVERHMRTPENGSGADRKIKLTSIAAIEAILAGSEAVTRLTGRTNRSIFPQ